MKRTTMSGFTLVEIMIVVAIIGLLASVAVPGLLKAIGDSRRRVCASNLKQIEGAKVRWALDLKKASTDMPGEADLFGPAGYIADKPACPGGGNYTLNNLETKPVCSVPDHTL